MDVYEKFMQIKYKKSDLHNTCLIPFRVSRVSSAISVDFYQGSHTKVAAVASRWQRVGDLIDSKFEPHTSRTRGRRLTTCAVWPVFMQMLCFIQYFAVYFH